MKIENFKDHLPSNQYTRNKKQEDNFQPSGFSIRNRSDSFALDEPKSELTRLNSKASNHLIWNCKVFETYERLDKTTVHTCAGIETILGKGQVKFRTGFSTLKPLRKQILDFNEHLILILKLTSDF